MPVLCGRWGKGGIWLSIAHLQRHCHCCGALRHCARPTLKTPPTDLHCPTVKTRAHFPQKFIQRLNRSCNMRKLLTAPCASIYPLLWKFFFLLGERAEVSRAYNPPQTEKKKFGGGTQLSGRYRPVWKRPFLFPFYFVIFFFCLLFLAFLLLLSGLLPEIST